MKKLKPIDYRLTVLFNSLLRRLCQSALMALLLGSASALSADTDVSRERISINGDWRFFKGDPADIGDQLSYPNIKDRVLATGLELTIDTVPAAKTRPAGNPGGNVSYAQSNFDDSSWRLLNLPHDWAIEGPFKQEYPGETGNWSGGALAGIASI